MELIQIKTKWLSGSINDLVLQETKETRTDLIYNMQELHVKINDAWYFVLDYKCNNDDVVINLLKQTEYGSNECERGIKQLSKEA